MVLDRAGRQPHLASRFLDDLTLAAYVPIRRLRHRLLWNPSRRLGIRAHGEASSPRIADEGGLREFTWESERLAAVEFEGNLPAGSTPSRASG